MNRPLRAMMFIPTPDFSNRLRNRSSLSASRCIAFFCRVRSTTVPTQRSSFPSASQTGVAVACTQRSSPLRVQQPVFLPPRQPRALSPPAQLPALSRGLRRGSPVPAGAQALLRCQPGHPGPGRVGIGVLPFLIYLENSDGCGLGQGLKALFTFPQGKFGLVWDESPRSVPRTPGRSIRSKTGKALIRTLNWPLSGRIPLDFDGFRLPGGMALTPGQWGQTASFPWNSQWQDLPM